MTLPALSAHTVLIDMDGTFTPTIELGDYFFAVLCRLVAQKKDLGSSQSESLVRSIFDPGSEPITDTHLKTLGIHFDEYWQAVLDWQEKHFVPYPDAVEMIQQLHAKGTRMFPATSNSGLACQAKLARANLADRCGSPYFAELFGGSEVSPMGKTGPKFFLDLLARIDCQADQVVMVGDDINADYEYAKRAGINQVVIVRRDQQEVCKRQDGGAILVKSLAIVPAMLSSAP